MITSHIVNSILKPELQHDNTLHVIGVCSNPARYHSRYRVFREWVEHMKQTKNIQLHLVEAAIGDRQHEVTVDSDGDLQLRTSSEIWIKENMINLGVKYLLPRDWRYMAWVDTDVFFRDPGWAQETLHQLQTFAVVQPWSDCADLGPQGGITQHFRSFGAQHQRRLPKQMFPDQTYYQYAHSGFAWACRREFYEAVAGLMDFAILGSADHHMAFAMIGEVYNTIHRGMLPSFFRRCYEWQSRALRVTNKEVGFVPGRIEHYFHGPKNRRYYRERWQIMVDAKFDPDHNLIYDAAGVVQLVGNPRLEQDVLMYNRSRHEDSIEEY
jgi:hypothetical protein